MCSSLSYKIDRLVFFVICKVDFFTQTMMNKFFNRVLLSVILSGDLIKSHKINSACLVVTDDINTPRKPFSTSALHLM